MDIERENNPQEQLSQPAGLSGLTRFHFGRLFSNELFFGTICTASYFALSSELYLFASRVLSPQSFTQEFISRFHHIVLAESAAVLTIGCLTAATVACFKKE